MESVKNPLHVLLEEIVTPTWVSSRLPDRMAYSRDQWPRHLIRWGNRQFPPMPDWIVWPANAKETAAVLAVCAKQGVPVCAVGGASSVTGASSPTQGGVVVDLKRLDRIRSLSVDDGVAEIEAGILGIHLENALQRAGWTMGHFPSSIMCSTLGGWVATRSAGQASSRYGKIEDMVFDLEIASVDGSVTWTRQDFDLTQILVGSEGTMGLITACRIKIHPAPQVRSFRGILFPSLESGLTAMRMLLQQTTPPPTILRLYDPVDSMISSHRKARAEEPITSLQHPHTPDPATYYKALVSYQNSTSVVQSTRRTWGAFFSKIRRKLIATALEHTDRGLSWLERLLPAQSLMILGYEEQTQWEADTRMQQALQLCLDLGAKDLGAGPGLHWFHHRYHVSFKQSQVFGLGAFSDTMEVASSWSQLSTLYRNVKSTIQKDALVMAHFSHAYPDGCSIYFSFAGHESSTQEPTRYDRIWKRGLVVASQSQATISHHHGVGINKAPAMIDELGVSGVSLMRTVQQVLSNSAPMNPGKLIPPVPPDTTKDGVGSCAMFAKQTQGQQALELPVLDKVSMLLTADSRHSLDTIESFAQTHGFSAGFRTGWDLSLQDWLEQGQIFAMQVYDVAPCQRIYGMKVRLPHGDNLCLGRAPRTAAGPGLYSLFWGTRGVLGQVEQVVLRLRPVSSRTSFWQIPFAHRDEAFARLRDWIHVHECPEDCFVAMSTQHAGCVLYLQGDWLQKTRIRRDILRYAEGSEVLSHPIFPVPSHPLWLGIESPWSALSAVLERLQELLPWSISQWALLQPSHASACVLCILEPQKNVEEEAERLASLCAVWQEQLRKMVESVSIFLWGAYEKKTSDVSSQRNDRYLQCFKQALYVGDAGEVSSLQSKEHES